MRGIEHSVYGKVQVIGLSEIWRTLASVASASSSLRCRRGQPAR